jgi:hypothetical protein
MTRLDDDEIARDRAARRVTRGGGAGLRPRWLVQPGVSQNVAVDELPFSIGI